jgi:cobalt-zinc-cadmium efflux system protein
LSAHHHHVSDRAATSRKLSVAAAATLLFVAAELLLGWRARSLALMGDALHNLTDAVALLLAFAAIRIERRPATQAKTYGYQRAGILAAFINAASLLAFTLYIFYEAATRLRAPRGVDSGVMLYTAVVALLLNTAITVALHREGQHDVNVRGAVVHMLGDAVSSVGIIIAALLIRATGSARWDALVSIGIGLLILWSSWDILRETINLLLEGTPRGIDPEKVTAAIASLEGIEGVHHVHIWALGPSRPALSCHLLVGDVPLRHTGTLRERICDTLHRDFGIEHTTIQFEFAQCDEDDPYCVPYSDSAQPREIGS